MKAPLAASLTLVLALAACEQDSQTLPFSPDSDVTTVRSLSAAEGGSVTSSAGAAIRFPAGSLNQSTEVSVTPVAPPAAARASGSAVSRGFRITPEALELKSPASVELRLDPKAESVQSWLASLVVVTPEGVQEVGATRVDLRAGLAEAPISQLGTVATVIPVPDAVFLMSRQQGQAALAGVASTLLPTGTDSIAADCGLVGKRCAGLSVTATANLWGKVSAAAAVYPRVSGRLVIDGDGATGEIRLASAVRLLLRSGATAENVELHGLMRATPATVVMEDASAITLTNMLVQVSGSAGTGENSPLVTRTVVIEKAGDSGFATLTRSFDLHDDYGQLEVASVDITFPVQLHQ